MRGCEEKASLPLKLGADYQTRCPLRPLYEDPEPYAHLFRIHRWFSQGHLPDSGSWLDQSATVVEALELIEEADAEAFDIEHPPHKPIA